MNSTNYWQIAGLVLQLVQMVLYIAGFIKYKNRLEDWADDLKTWADEKFLAYQTLRSKDQSFFDYYNTLPDYEPCQSNIDRSKGAAFSDYGNALRRTQHTVRGFLPLQRSQLANHLGRNAVQATAMKRVQTTINERSRQDDHVLRRWQAIVSAPTHPSSHSDASSIIKNSFKSLEAFGKGANSAGAALGTGLYKTGFLK